MQRFILRGPNIGVLVIILLLIGVGFISGCGGGGGGTSGGTDSLSAMGALSTKAMQDTLPAGSEVVSVVDTATTAGSDDELLEPDNALTRAGGTFTQDSHGLHFSGTWDKSTIPLDIVGTITVTGTLTGTGTSADGTTVDLVRTASVTSGSGEITLVGVLTAPGGKLYHINITRTLSVGGTVMTVHTVAIITLNGAEILSKDVTRSIDKSAAIPRQRTIDGTVTYHDPVTISSFVTVAYTNLVYVPDNGHTDFISGWVVITNEDGFTATLTAKTDKSLSGPIKNRNDVTVGTMTIKDGVVTIKRS